MYKYENWKIIDTTFSRSYNYIKKSILKNTCAVPLQIFGSANRTKTL